MTSALAWALGGRASLPVHENITVTSSRAISAPQIGIQKRIIAMNLDDGQPSFAMLNPVITWRSEASMSLWDDCFSFPWLLVRVRRHRSISVHFSLLGGSTTTWENLPEARSELLQHEIDHLDGVLAVDIALSRSEMTDNLGSLVSREVFDKNRSVFEAVVDYTIPSPPHPENVRQRSRSNYISHVFQGGGKASIQDACKEGVARPPQKASRSESERNG